MTSNREILILILCNNNEVLVEKSNDWENFKYCAWETFWSLSKGKTGREEMSKIFMSYGLRNKENFS